jgi:L-lactate utilization protein LutC
MNSREAILNRIRTTNKIPSIIKEDDPRAEERIRESIISLTPKDKSGLWNQFKTEFELINGNFYSVKDSVQAADVVIKFIKENKLSCIGTSGEDICKTTIKKVEENIPELKVVSSENLNFEERKKEFSSIELAVVHPFFAVADIGSLVFLYDQTRTSIPHFLCDNTFVLINRNQIAANQFELLESLNKEESKNMVFVAGPSRTADIEKVLVLGAHGPRNLTVILIDEN